jgi:VCBS repeat protein
LKFEASAFGNPKSADSREPPVLGHVQVVDLDRDGLADVVVCDIDKSLVSWVHRRDGKWQEETLAKLPYPAHTQVARTNEAGPVDLVVACLGAPAPTEEPVGSVVLLANDGAMHFRPLTILDRIGRVADVEPGDFDGDGDVDFVVAAYGYINAGEVGWLENQSDGKYLYHTIVKRTGAIHVLPTDLDRDGRLDFVALFAQEHEQISAFINHDHGRFQEHVLFKAATPSFGSSGIELVDLDGDGDMDILYTNGDNMDLPTMIPRPFHGVQWLENKGNLKFVWHDIRRFYGAYCAVAADLNNDGKLDIIATSMFNDWTDPRRASLMWLENDGEQHFTAHTIARDPIHLISAAVADLDGDGWLDIVACGMHAFPPSDRTGRITLWKNRHQPR